MSRWRSDDGQITAFVVGFFLALVVLAGLVIDGGYTLAARRRAFNEAQAAARAGAQALSVESLRQGEVTLDPDTAAGAAEAYLARVGHTGSVSVSDNEVRVTVSFSQPMFVLAGIGSLTVTGHGSARNVSGVVWEGP